VETVTKVVGMGPGSSMASTAEHRTCDRRCQHAPPLDQWFDKSTDLAVYKSVQVEGRREGDFLLHYWALSEILLSLTPWWDVV